jgi:hypothetical protein
VMSAGIAGLAVTLISVGSLTTLAGASRSSSPAVVSRATTAGHLESSAKLGAAWVPGLLGLGTVRPKTLQYGTGQYKVIGNVKWSSWGGAEAVGHGTGWYVVKNAPAKNESVDVVAFDLGTCGNGDAYTGLDWYFPEEHQSRSLNPYLEICVGDQAHQGCDPAAVARVLSSVGAYSGWNITTLLCEGDYAITQITNGTTGKEPYLKRSGKTWVVLQEGSGNLGYEHPIGMPASTGTSLYAQLSGAKRLSIPIVLNP